jgi:hypothetical protein
MMARSRRSIGSITRYVPLLTLPVDAIPNTNTTVAPTYCCVATALLHVVFRAPQSANNPNRCIIRRRVALRTLDAVCALSLSLDCSHPSRECNTISYAAVPSICLSVATKMKENVPSAWSARPMWPCRARMHFATRVSQPGSNGAKHAQCAAPQQELTKTTGCLFRPERPSTNWPSSLAST